MDLKKIRWSEYKPGTIVGFSSSIRKHLSQLRSDINPDKDFFPLAHSTMLAKPKDWKAQGKGNLPNKAELLTRDHEQKMWESGAQRDTSAEVLHNTLWY